jgi:hypothetical protein
LNSYTIDGTGAINMIGNIAALGNIKSNSMVTNSISTVDTNVIGLEIITKANNGLDLCIFNGLALSPETMIAGDNLGQMTIRGYNGSNYNSLSVALNGSLDATAVVTDLYPKSMFRIFVGAGGENITQASFNHDGVFTAPTFSAGDGSATTPSIVFTTDGGVDSGFFHPGDGIVCISTNAVERVRVDSGGMRVEGFMKVKDLGVGALPSPAEAGMIVLQNGTFQGYNGSSWVTLG